jgi:hypothetical protein
MPKITTLLREIAGEHIQLVLSYNATSMFHISAGMPEKMKELTSEFAFYGHEKQTELEKVLRAAITAYEAKLKSERKVLLVTISLGRATAASLDLPKEHPIRGWSRSSGFYRPAENYGFDLKVELALETSTGEHKQYRYLHQSEDVFQAMRGTVTRPDVLKDVTRVMDWTPEREEYFKNMIAATLALGQQLADFFTEDEQLFLENVDGGQKLLGQ